MAPRGDALAYGVWLVATSLQPYPSPEAMNKEAVDDWVDLIFLVFGLSVAGVFLYLPYRLNLPDTNASPLLVSSSHVKTWRTAVHPATARNGRIPAPATASHFCSAGCSPRCL
jgi:hypothetical protein